MRSEREQLPRVFEKQQCLLNHQCSTCNAQDLTLFWTTKAAAAVAAPPPHGEEGGRPGRACCYVVCTRNSTLPINNFCGTPHFFSEYTGYKQWWYSEITEIVNFLVLFLSRCLSTAFVSWFVCRKMLTWYLPRQIERLDTFYARCSTSSWLLRDRTTWFERKFFCSLCRSERETVAEVLFGSFTMVGSQSIEGNWTSIMSEFTCQYSHSCRSCCSSLGYYFCLGLNLAEFFSQVLCTSWILVVGWRR